ncbi:uncharacterized protein LOC115442965 [Manduca sexta]|uniref:Uncharacterized protein n=1 Tax=Manduca sexta TaxID=7130 RepID=A0A921Z1W9_MANSE|nr:uncharacterized protein LOC115442965 [Manduca sexta]KAG6449280.1 hypothetical protein O3G_MSEX005948 [Manduca sexta]
MNPLNLEYDDCDLQEIQTSLNKETQTSEAIIICDSKTSHQIPKTSSKNELNSPDKGSITVFEFCKILQDPECPKSVTIIKESVSEEVQKHPKQPTSEEGVANRYKYCKEVITPYLQTYPTDSAPSEEKLIKEILESVQQDFPDYKPCLEKYQDKSLDSRQSSVSKVDAVTSYDLKPSNTKMNKDNIDEAYSKIKQRPGCFPTDFDTPSGIPDPGCEIQNAKIKSEKPVETKSAESVKSPCPPKKKAAPIVCDPSCEAECAGNKEKVKKKKSPMDVADGCPPPVDYCTRAPKTSETQSKDNIDKKVKKSPTVNVAEKKASLTGKIEKAPESKVEKKEIPKTDSECSSLLQIRCAMEDFITKVCTTTHETVTMIRKGSFSQLDDSESPCDQEENDEKKSEESKGFCFFRKVDGLSKDNDYCESTAPEETIDDVDKVDSAFSNMSDSIDFDDLPDPSNPDIFDSCDEPTSPKQISNIIVQTNITYPVPVPQSSSVFAAIKTRIYSLFSDEKKGDSESISSNYSQESEGNEDADVMEKTIE